MVELFPEIQTSLQQKVVLPQLQLSLSLLRPRSGAVIVVSLEMLLPVLKATEGI